MPPLFFIPVFLVKQKEHHVPWVAFPEKKYFFIERLHHVENEEDREIWKKERLNVRSSVPSILNRASVFCSVCLDGEVLRW
jgi:hypothetical protein